jgi:AcrR family transcriptional regulator
MTETTAKPRTTTRGVQSRNAILRQAAQLATVEGIEGLSIARLADSVGMSKSGLFAHFGSKEELQLATIETASAIFSEHVTEPAERAGSGLERLRQLSESYLRHVQDSVFPGGCFFASIASEMDTHPGPVRDRAIEFMEGWIELIAGFVRQAQAEGTIDRSVDAEQLAFEIESHMLLANALFVAKQEPTPIERGRQAIDDRLAAAATPRPAPGS